jgi:hypothetical protein
VPHATVGELLLELVAGILDALASGLDVVDGDADVAEAAVGLGVARVDLVLGVVLSAVVVRLVGSQRMSLLAGPGREPYQLDDALTIED